MRLPKREREALNEAIDLALADATGDVALASKMLALDLEDWEGGGVWFAGDLRSDCMLVGIKQMVRNRMRSQRISVRDQAMPLTYTFDGSASPWTTVSVGDLDHVIHRLESQAHTLNERAGVLDEARTLAREHGVDTAAEAYRLEGVIVTELAS
jgi:hypothetical protein